MNFFGTKDIARFVEWILQAKKSELENKIIIDLPAGGGYHSRILKSLGAVVKPLDLFPEFFKGDELECKKADLTKELPIASDSADFVLCQEGVEHVPNQLFMFTEFNRILKKDGVLMLTTPNYSNLRSRLSYLLAESEHWLKIMPPNEIDSVWHSDDNDVYMGHVFLVGIQKLRLLARLAGFKIKKVHHLRVGHTSLILLILFYPLIVLVNILAYMRAMRKGKALDKEQKKVYGEVLKLSLDPRILVDTHLFVEFDKV